MFPFCVLMCVDMQDVHFSSGASVKLLLATEWSGVKFLEG